MTTINLHQENEREEMIKDTGRINSSLVFFLLVFGIITISFVGLKFGSSYVEKKNSEIKNQIFSENEALNGKKSVDEVIDLQFRLNEVKKNIAKKTELNEVLDNISKAVIPGIVFSSYTNTDKKILLTFRSSNFDSISRQVFNFKKADSIANVEVKNLVRDEKGIKCDVEIGIK